MTGTTLQGRMLNPGKANGEALVLTEPLSFWGGYDPATGRILDRQHPQHGAVAAGHILVLPASRGSAGTPAGLAESLRRGTGPAAILVGRTDVNLAIGAMVAARLYKHAVPVVQLPDEAMRRLRTGQRMAVMIDGWVVLPD